MKKTFGRRKTDLPTDKMPVAFTEEFYQDEIKQKQWKGFCEKNRRYIGDLSLREVCLAIAEFLMPVMKAIAQDELLQQHWNPPGPWK